MEEIEESDVLEVGRTLRLEVDALHWPYGLEGHWEGSGDVPGPQVLLPSGWVGDVVCDCVALTWMSRTKMSLVKVKCLLSDVTIGYLPTFGDSATIVVSFTL